MPDAPPTPDAPPNCNNECVNDNTQYCDENGMAVVCPLGCSDTGGAHCLAIVPSNGADDTHLADVTGDLIIRNGEVGTISTTTGAVSIDDTLVRDIGDGNVDGGIGFYHLSDSLAVLAVNSLTVESGGELQPSGTRALIILSANDVTIGGLIDISGGCADGNPECAGPGGGRGATSGSSAQGCGPGDNGTEGAIAVETGGGGGALGAVGASGGWNTNSGGVTDNCPGETLVPLAGGSGGGKGARVGGAGGNGGGGGGALQITSRTRIVFVAGGAIWAGGGGGGPGTGSNDDGGGGGGSGGAILLEAPEIMAAGANITANGGGGGGGSGSAEAGAEGTQTTAQAAGGDGGRNSGDNYRGGPGGSLDGAAGEGASGGDGTGGGGGGVGIIRINAPADKLDITNATISPAHTRGDIAVQ